VVIQAVVVVEAVVVGVIGLELQKTQVQVALEEKCKQALVVLLVEQHLFIVVVLFHQHLLAVQELRVMQGAQVPQEVRVMPEQLQLASLKHFQVALVEMLVLLEMQEMAVPVVEAVEQVIHQAPEHQFQEQEETLEAVAVAFEEHLIVCQPDLVKAEAEREYVTQDAQDVLIAGRRILLGLNTTFPVEILEVDMVVDGVMLVMLE
jgi:hypothetical protein